MSKSEVNGSHHPRPVFHVNFRIHHCTFARYKIAEAEASAGPEVAEQTLQNFERQRSALPRCRYHRPRSWTRAERPRRPSIRLPVVSWQAPERQRSALSCCRYHWPRHWKRAQRPHRPSNLSGCQSCPGKHRSVSAAPRRVAGATGRAARRERPPLSSTRSTLSTISLVPRHLFAATASGHRSILGV